MAESRVEKRWLEEAHADGPAVRLPVFEAIAPRDGPTVAIVAGMHGGEYVGVLAAMHVIRRLTERPGQLQRGRAVIVPIMSTLAFFGRSMQLSPVDQHEVHYVWPGRVDGSYSEHLVDLVFRTFRSADAVLDLHAGEFVQDLTPYVCVPQLSGANPDLWERSLQLAENFDVPFVNRRTLEQTPLALPRALLDAGIPNIWTEIGRNGLVERRTLGLQHKGLLNTLRAFGVLSGHPRRFSPRVLGPRQWSVFAEESGIWWPAVRAGQHVEEGQLLGELRDVFGTLLARYMSPAHAVATYVCTSPAIDVGRKPHGYAWHQQVVQLLDDLP